MKHRLLALAAAGSLALALLPGSGSALLRPARAETAMDGCNNQMCFEMAEPSYLDARISYPFRACKRLPNYHCVITYSFWMGYEFPAVDCAGLNCASLRPVPVQFRLGGP